MINKKQEEENYQRENNQNIIDKPEKKILQEMNIDKQQLKTAQKKISLHAALGNVDDNPLKLTLDKLPQQTQNKQILRDKRSSAEYDSNGEIGSNRYVEMQQRFASSGYDLQSITQNNNGQRQSTPIYQDKIRISHTAVASPKNIDKYVKGLNSPKIPFKQDSKLNSSLKLSSQLTGNQYRPKSQVQKLSLNTLENQNNQSFHNNPSNTQPRTDGLDQSFVIQSSQGPSVVGIGGRPLYTIKEQSLEQLHLRGDNTSNNTGSTKHRPNTNPPLPVNAEFLPSIDNSNKQPIPSDEISKIQNQINSNKQVQERRKLNSSNQLTQFSGMNVTNILNTSQLVNLTSTNNNQPNVPQTTTNRQQMQGMIMDFNGRLGSGGGARVGSSGNQAKGGQMPLEVKFENFDSKVNQPRKSRRL